MIEIKDLAVGNTFSRRHGKGETWLTVDEKTFASIFDDHSLDIALDDLDPVILTVELFEEYCFDKLEDKYVHKNLRCFHFMYVKSIGWQILTNQGCHLTYITYLHELQTFYRCIVQEEMESKN